MHEHASTVFSVYILHLVYSFLLLDVTIILLFPKTRLMHKTSLKHRRDTEPQN